MEKRCFLFTPEEYRNRIYYTKRLLAKTGLADVRVYVDAYNLFTFADSFVKPFDPEKIEGAYGCGFSYPVMKSYNIGVNVSF